MPMVKTSFEFNFVKTISQNIVILIPKNRNLNILKVSPFEGDIPNILMIGDIKRKGLTGSTYGLEFIGEILPEYLSLSIPVIDECFTHQLWKYLIEYFNDHIRSQQKTLFQDGANEIFSVSEDQIRNFVRHYYPELALQLDDGQIIKDEAEEKLSQMRQLMNKIINMPKSELEELNLKIGGGEDANATSDDRY